MIKYIVFTVLILSTSIGFCKEDNRRGVFIKFLSSSQEVAIKVNELKIIGESLEKKIISDFDTKKLYVMSKKDIETILPPGKSLEDCDGKCDVAIGRLLQADIIISSRLSQGFGKYFVHISVVDTKTSEILNKEIISAKSLELLLMKTNNFNLEIKRKVKSYTLNTGLLTISTAPPSEIFVDGKSIGNTPVVSAKLEEGSHMIEMFTLKERKRYVEKISIISGKETFKKIFLKEESRNKKVNNEEKIRREKKKYKDNSINRRVDFHIKSINRVDFHIKLDLNSKVYIDNNSSIWVKDEVLSLTPGEHLFKFYNTTGVLTKRVDVSRNNNKLVLNFKKDKITDYKRKDRINVNNVSNESMSNLQLLIKKTVLSKGNLYKSCYERYFNRIGFEDIDGIAFRTVFKIKIDKYGNAFDIFLEKFSGVAKDKYSYAFKPFKRCMISHLRRLRFGIKARNITFVYPFNFKMYE